MATIGSFTAQELTRRFVTARDRLLGAARAGGVVDPAEVAQPYRDAQNELGEDRFAAEEAARVPGDATFKSLGVPAAVEAEQDWRVQEQANALQRLIAVLQQGGTSKDSLQRAAYEIAQHPGVVGLRLMADGEVELTVTEAAKDDVRAWFYRHSLAFSDPLRQSRLTLVDAVKAD